MNANALLLSRDKEVQMILPALLGDMRIETEIAIDVLRAVRLLSEQKFEAILVDCELKGADAVLKDIDSYPSNRTGVLFAIVPKVEVRNGLPPGAKFVIAKPISAEQARSSLDAASSLLIGEYRRYFRCALEVPIHLAGANRGSLLIDLLDLIAGHGTKFQHSQDREGNGRSLAYRNDISY